jgi:GMP synthase-like glutamine amidotransferase
MKLSILLAGENPDLLRARFGSYAQKFENMLAPVDNSFTFETIRVLDGEQIPDPAHLQGVIVTGSAKGVYDDVPWMEPLREAIRDLYAAGVPMLGICFGHQVMAEALGGTVTKSAKGWGLGRHVYELNGAPEYISHPSGRLAVAASHQDQVIVAPATARTFLSSPFTPNAGLTYANGAAMSMQPHPEFEIDYSAAIFELRRNNPLSDKEVERAVDTLAQPMDNEFVAGALAAFFLQFR